MQYPFFLMATVAAIHESDEPLEFPESPAPSPNNDKKVGHLLEADWSLLDYDGSDRVDQPNSKLEEVQESDDDGSISFTGGIRSCWFHRPQQIQTHHR